MKNLVIIFLLLVAFKVNGQGLFFIGEKSSISTEGFNLKSNSDEYFINDLEIKFLKDEANKMIALTTKTKDVNFAGKLIIYLDNGMVITTSRESIFDYVDKLALAIFYLTDDDFRKLNSYNINTIKYSLKNEYGSDGPFGGNFSASNKSKVDFPQIISEFYKK